MIIYARYLELKERLEEKKKKMEFMAPSIKDTILGNETVEVMTTDNEGRQPNRGKRRKRRKKNTNRNAEATTETERSGAEDTDR
jgi:hypothetical protein